MEHQRRCTLLNPVIIMLVAAVLLSPMVAQAEGVTFVRTTPSQHGTLAEPLKNSRLGLDDDGNVMVRVGGMKVTFVYEAGSSAPDSRETTSRASQRQDVACLGGVSVKLGFTF